MRAERVRPQYELPEEGLDIRAELVGHQRALLELALSRARGDVAFAARLLRVTPKELARMQTGALVSRSAARPRVISLAAVGDDDLPRIEQRGDTSVQVISRAAIQRLGAEGYSARAIATRLGVNPFVVEKVLRGGAGLAKCGPRPAPDES